MSDYWMARIGRSPLAHFLPTGVVAVLSTGYYAYHSGCIGLLKEYYGYYDTSGKRDTLSDDLRKLIGEVYVEAKDKANLSREYFENRFTKPSSVTWFACSTLEPISFGMTEFKSGSAIGLPYYYNYKSHNDIPDSALELKKLKLFRNPFKSLKKDQTSEQENDKELVASVTGNSPTGRPKLEIIRKFDRNSDLGREFMDTFVLSDDAKRFSVARELFIIDSYRVVTNSIIIAVCGLVAVSAARFSVAYFKALKSPIAVRIPYYMLSGIYGYGLYKIAISESEKHYYIKAKENAKKLGDNYARGADEYFEKCKRRRELLQIGDPRDNDY